MSSIKDTEMLYKINKKNVKWWDDHLLQMYQKLYGAMTSKTALDEALKAEQEFKGHGIFTTPYLELKMKSECLFDYALLLEKEEQLSKT